MELYLRLLPVSFYESFFELVTDPIPRSGDCDHKEGANDVYNAGLFSGDLPWTSDCVICHRDTVGLVDTASSQELRSLGVRAPPDPTPQEFYCGWSYTEEGLRGQQSLITPYGVYDNHRPLFLSAIVAHGCTCVFMQ